MRILSPAPHIHSEESIEKIMYWVVIALIPALIWSIHVFGINALRVIVLCAGSSVLIEYVLQRIFKIKITAFDGSALITGLLLAMNLSSSSPWWICIIGSFIAIGLAKFAFGGLGGNIFNPALVARVALLISFPVQMTNWPKPFVDSITSATPLAGNTTYSLMDLFIGRVGGCLGEVSVLFLLLGAVILLIKGYIKWDIPFSYIASFSLFILIVNLINPGSTNSIAYHVFSGGLILGAFFMATDMVTSPITTKGRIIFGIGCGIITALIRLYGSYPEGVSFSILLMNAVVPTIDKFIKPRIYGAVK
jgi:electron transport complex protein RnfD